MLGENANHAWTEMLQAVMERGKECQPRNMKIKELIGYQSVVDMQHPVVTIRDRKLSRRFLAAEAVWILTGDNRVSTIAPYNSAIAKFSDDGVYFNGAYGPRIVDQLTYVVDSLVKDPDSRQAVLTIWRPNPRPSKDIPCLDGKTIIWSPEGNLTICELAEKFSSGAKSYPIFAFNTQTRTIEIAECRGAWSTGVKRKKRIVFDDGSELLATDNHILYKKVRRHVDGDARKSSRTFVEETKIRDLNVGDRLWATAMFASGPQDRPTFIKNIGKGWTRNNQVAVCREYAEFLFGPLPKGIDVHHKNNDNWDNRRENLELLPHAAHAAVNMFGVDNPMSRETEQKKDARRLKLRETLIAKGFNARPIEEYACNHKIVAIEDAGEGEVFDFTVPIFENAVVGTGLVAHNCTVAVQWFIRHHVDGMGVAYDLLHCVDTMRSSDAWLGWPYDVFNFSMLSAYVALLYRERTGKRLTLGRLHMNCGSQHVYENNWEAVQKIIDVVQYDNTYVHRFDHNDVATPGDLIEHLRVVRDGRTENMQYGFLKEIMPPSEKTP